MARLLNETDILTSVDSWYLGRSRDCLMYYRGPGSLPPLPSESCLSVSVFHVWLRLNLLTGGGLGVGEGAKSYDSEKASFSIIH
jgi:hypothetical protein